MNNSNLDGVVSFVRKKGNQEILVLINLTNRITTIQVDVPPPDYAQARDLLKNRTLPLLFRPTSSVASLAPSIMWSQSALPSSAKDKT